MKRLVFCLLSTCLLIFATFAFADDAAVDNPTTAMPVVPVVEEKAVLAGSNLTLTCPTAKEKEHPEWWQMNNYAIVEANSNGPVTGKQNAAIDGKDLKLSNITFSDEGAYSCSDTASPMATFIIKVHAIPLAPVIWALPPDAALIDKQKQKVTCESRYGRPVSTIKWQVDGQDQEPLSAVIRQEANGTLTISSSVEVSVTNQVVQVTCTAEHPGLPDGSPQKLEASTQLRTYTLTTPSVAPAKLEPLRHGQTIVVDCRIPDTNGATRPSLIWTLPDGFERQQVVIENGFIVNRMSLIVAREMNNKMLTCRSELSHARSAPVELKMNIAYAPTKPTLAVIMPNGKTEIGLNNLTAVKVNCDGVDANPKAVVRILINGAEVNVSSAEPLLANTAVWLLPGRVLTSQISDSVRSTGKRTTVSCIAYNSIGSGGSDAVTLPVYAPPTGVRLGPISPADGLERDPTTGIISVRSGANVTFFCDMTGGELSEQAKTFWLLRCPVYADSQNPDASAATPEVAALTAVLVDKFNATTELAIDSDDRQHARAYFSRVLTKDDNECQLTCQAVDPVAGNSEKNLQPQTLSVFYGPEEINVRFGQAAAYNDGESVQAICEMGAAKPEPTVSWSILTALGANTTIANVSCTSGLLSTCNATKDFVAEPHLTGSIIRCTATNPKLGIVVSTDRRLEVLFKPRSANPSRCFSIFVMDFSEKRNLTEHCAFQSNPPIDSQQTHIWLESAANSSNRQRVSPAGSYPAQVDGGRPPWEMVHITRRFNTIEDFNFLDSYLIVTLQNAVGVSEFRIPVRINLNIIDVRYVNPSTMQDEIWAGDSVQVTCTISSLYKVTRFAFNSSLIRQGDIIVQASPEARTITLNIPRVQQDVNLVGEVRRVGCFAEFPPDTGVKPIKEPKDIKINRPIEAVGIKLETPNVRCRPTVGDGGKLQYRWFENGTEVSNVPATQDFLKAANRSRYECEITQLRGAQILSVKRSDEFIVGETPLNAIFYDMNVTGLRVFSSVAEFFVAKKLQPDVVIGPTAVLPAGELRVSLQRDGNEQEYRLTVRFTGDWHVFNITDLLPGSTYNFTFWAKAPMPAPSTPSPNMDSETWRIVSTIVISTTGAPLAVLRLRPEETAIVVILTAVAAALFLLFCNIFICIKIRRKRQLMAEVARRTGRRSSSCCFRDGINKDETNATADTSPPASEAESAPTSVDMLTPNGASCSSSTSTGSAGALYIAGADNSSTIKSKSGTTRRKSSDFVEVVQGFFRPDGLLLKPKYASAQKAVDESAQAPSNSIYRELFGDASMSPIIPNLDFFVDPTSNQLPQLGGHQPVLLDDSSLYRSQPTAVYSIPMPFQYQHVGGSESMPVTATAIAAPTNTANKVSTSSELPLELQGDLV